MWKFCGILGNLVLKSYNMLLFQNPYLLGVHIHTSFVHLRDGAGSQAGGHHPGVWYEDWELQAQGSHSGGCLQGGLWVLHFGMGPGSAHNHSHSGSWK